MAAASRTPSSTTAPDRNTGHPDSGNVHVCPFMRVFTSSRPVVCHDQLHDWYADLPCGFPCRSSGASGDRDVSSPATGGTRRMYLIMWVQTFRLIRVPRCSLVFRGSATMVPVVTGYLATTSTTPSSLTSGCPPRQVPTRHWQWRWATSSSRRTTSTSVSSSSRTSLLTYTDLPFLVTLETREDGIKVPSKFWTAAKLRWRG